MELSTITSYLETLLSTSTLPDYSVAMNGLQVENKKRQVTKISASVDAHLPVVEKAIAQGSDLLLVHHGLFWRGAQPITGALYEKLRLCMEHDLAIYSVHLPLDGHSLFGNSILLAKALNLGVEWAPFFPYKNFPIGVRGETSVSRDELTQRLSQAVGGRVHVCPGGPELIRNIGVITGGAGSEVASMRDLGIDTLITGEGPHWSYTLAEEVGVNLLYGGHYATETFGVKALAEHLSEQFSLEWGFIDHPTGL